MPADRCRVGPRRPDRADPQRHPRADRRAGGGGPRRRGSGGPRRHAGPPVAAGPLDPTARSSWRSRSPSIRSRPRPSGLGGEVFDHRPGGPARAVASSVDDIVDDLVELAAERRAAGAVRGQHRRRRRRRRRRRPPERRHGLDGPEPRLAGRAARRACSPQALGSTSRSPSRTMPTSRPSPSIAAGRRAASMTCCSSGARVGVGGGLIVDGPPLTGAAGYGGEVGHIPVNPDGLAVPLRLDRLLGDRGRDDGAAAARRPLAPGRSRGLRGVLAEAEAGDPGSSGRLQRDWRAGWGSGWPGSSTCSIRASYCSAVG